MQENTNELITLLESGEAELKKAKESLDEAFQELNKMYEENKKLKDNLNIARYLIDNLTQRNISLEKENKLMKEFMLNEN